MNRPLKLLRNMHCTNCNVQFFFRDLAWKGARYPMLLQCGHSVCESCLQKRLKSMKSVLCQECNFISLPDEHASEGFPLSIYLLGSLVALQNYKYDKDKRLALFAQNSENFNYSLKRLSGDNLEEHLDGGVCEECSVKASWYCENCKSNFCEICWSKVHGSARSLMKHCKIALCSIGGMNIGLKKCPKHETQDLEFYCLCCSKTICSHCVILQHQGEGHCPITLKEKNKEMITEVKTAAEEAEITRKRMKQTLEKIKHTQSSCGTAHDELMSDFENKITKNFSRIHGILQLEEERWLKKLHDRTSRRQDCLDAMSKQLEMQIQSVESLLSECERAMKSPQYGDLTEVHRQLKEVENLPCYLITEKADLKEARITFDENLVECIRKYCSMDVPPMESFQLRSSGDLPQGYSVEPLDEDSDSCKEPKFAPKAWAESSVSGIAVVQESSVPDTAAVQESSVSDVDSVTSNCFSRELAKGDSDLSQSKGACPPKVFCERRNYSVRVTYIKNPGEFYVALNSQRPKQQAIEKRAYSFAGCSSAVPRTVEKDDIYLVMYSVDKKWYRGRVVERSTRKVEGEESVVIYYVDYGNTEVVPLSRLRAIPADMTEEPPLAVKCKLFDCVPKKGQWCTESTKTMEKILNNYTATMFVMKINQDCLEVDLSVIYPEGQIGRDIISVRDALLFLEFSSFVGGCKIPQNATAVKYLHQCLPTVGEVFDAIITHVNTPVDFYIQRTRQDTSYLLKLTTDLQNYYEENSHKGIIYNPVIGMPCAAMFSVDHKWYRAKIVDIPGKRMVTVFYVDYGNKETIPWMWIRKLKECFVRRPPLALNCGLSGIRPTDGDWNSQTTLYLEKCVLVRDCRVQIQVKPKPKQPLQVLLYKRGNDKEVCVNTVFIETGCAALCPLGSQWVSDAREQEPVSEKGSGPLPKSRALKERKRSKLSAKKLREMHEFEKRSRDRSSAGETEDEVDEHDNNIFMVKVDVLSAESPSSVYVTFPTLTEELKNLQLKLNEFYEGSVPDVVKEWTVGSVCAVYCSERSGWYRASVLSLLPDGRVKVFLKDVAQVATEQVSSLRELESSFTKYVTCAVRCHLADIAPPAEQWPSISTEHLQIELDNYKEVYMTKKGQIENKSLPVELWVRKIVARGALEPTAKEWVTLNKLLVDQGLAVPKKSKLWYSGIPSNNEESSDEEMGSEDVLAGSCEPAPDKMAGDGAEESSKAFLPSLGSRWLPPEPLKQRRFIGVPTYVDFDACIYIRDVERDEALNAVCESLLKEFGNSKPAAEDRSWSQGQMCIARYHNDDSWYRGVVLQANENVSYDVLFVDYGNIETCQASDLRKRIKTQEIPVVTNKFQLRGIQPVAEDGKWPVSVIEILHSLVVDKKCEVAISEPSPDSGEECIVSLKIIEDDIDVCTFLVDQDLAVITRSSSATSKASDSDVPPDKTSALDSAKIGGDSYASRYVPMSIPVECTGFSVRVTTMTTENEFFANVVDDDSLSPGLKSVLKEFESLQGELMKDGHSLALVESLSKGAPCCCLNPGNNKWCRGEIESSANIGNSVCVFFVDHGSRGLVDKDLLHECKYEWLILPKMAVKFRLVGVERCPTVSKSVYMKTLTDCLKEAVFFAKIEKDEGVLGAKLLTEDNGSLVYQDMINRNLMRFTQ